MEMERMFTKKVVISLLSRLIGDGKRTRAQPILTTRTLAKNEINENHHLYRFTQNISQQF